MWFWVFLQRVEAVPREICEESRGQFWERPQHRFVAADFEGLGFRV